MQDRTYGGSTIPSAAERMHLFTNESHESHALASVDTESSCLQTSKQVCKVMRGLQACVQ